MKIYILTEVLIIADGVSQENILCEYQQCSSILETFVI